MKRYFYGTLLVLCFLFQWAYAEGATLAFPGAEGFGRFAQGGRGGQVIEVTNIKDSGPGSFRSALEATGPRTVVFLVSGTLDLVDRIKITNPFITIAGQTAPGGGVTIKGMLDIQTHDVIIRYLRVRVGAGSLPDPEVRDSLQLFTAGATNIILDHCSFSWGVDETLSILGDASYATAQWSFISESLHSPTPPHPEGPHGKGVLLGYRATKLSFHHNLIAHHPDRNPNMTSGDLDVVNNVIYNYGGPPNARPGDGILKINYVGNYAKDGPDTPAKPGALRLYGGQPFNSGSGVYLEGNIHPTYRPNNTLPETDIAYHNFGPPDLAVAGSRYDYPLVTTTDAFQAYNDVLDKAGATLPVPDSVDTRIVSEVRNNTGKIINMPSEVGGYPTLSSGTPPPDTDHDGMPDSWEVAQGFNPNNASDGPQDADGDGYTNLEEYLNGIGSQSDMVAPKAPQGIRVS